MDNAGDPIVYHTDGLGSVRALTDASGNVAQSYQYDEYGVPVSSQGSIDQPFRYTGEQYDPETGFVYLRARYYEPGSGRFAQRDPLWGSTLSPGGQNRYAYVQGNPINATDSAGLCAQAVGGVSLRDMQCPEIQEEIGRAYEELKTRGGQLREDPLGLQFGHWDKANPLMTPEGGNLGSIASHQDEYRNWQKRLRNLLTEWDIKDCGAGGPGGVPSDAWRVATQAPPVPVRRDQFNLSEGVAIGGAAYLAYRVVRAVPSFAVPGLEWTIPFNLATP